MITRARGGARAFRRRGSGRCPAADRRRARARGAGRARRARAARPRRETRASSAGASASSVGEIVRPAVGRHREVERGSDRLDPVLHRQRRVEVAQQHRSGLPHARAPRSEARADPRREAPSRTTRRSPRAWLAGRMRDARRVAEGGDGRRGRPDPRRRRPRRRSRATRRPERRGAGVARRSTSRRRRRGGRRRTRSGRATRGAASVTTWRSRSLVDSAVPRA